MKSRTGCILLLLGCLIVLISKLQRGVYLSIVESEYITLSTEIIDLLPIREFLDEVISNININHNQTTNIRNTVFEDTNGSLKLTLIPRMSPRTKHITTQCHYFRIKMGNGTHIHIKRVSQDKIADIFTKGF